MLKKGYRYTTKSQPGTLGYCQENGGQWDQGTRSCDMPTTETARANETPEEKAKLEATTRYQCMALNGEWDQNSASCS